MAGSAMPAYSQGPVGLVVSQPLLPDGVRKIKPIQHPSALSTSLRPSEIFNTRT
jgi:hypothetical protein